MDSDSKILVAGANGMVGSAIVRNLESKGYKNIVKGTRQVIDFTDRQQILFNSLIILQLKNFCFLVLPVSIPSLQLNQLEKTS